MATNRPRWLGRAGLPPRASWPWLALAMAALLLSSLVAAHPRLLGVALSLWGGSSFVAFRALARDDDYLRRVAKARAPLRRSSLRRRERAMTASDWAERDFRWQRRILKALFVPTWAVVTALGFLRAVWPT